MGAVTLRSLLAPLKHRIKVRWLQHCIEWRRRNRLVIQHQVDQALLEAHQLHRQEIIMRADLNLLMGRKDHERNV